jgi:CRP/FNR family transcriptional regulator, cyclic AMP receptor protein
MSQLTDHLGEIPLFAGCSPKDLQRLARAADELSLPAGTVLTTQGDVGREAFVLLEGTAEVVRDGGAVAELGPGDHVGELSLLDGGPRTATVTATTDVDLLVLSVPAFNGVLDEIPTLAHKLAVSLARRLRAAEDVANVR